MPKMDGFEVVRRIRELPKLQFIPVLLVTGFDYDYLQKIDDIKIDGFIQKPIDFEQVTSKIRQILERNS